MGVSETLKRSIVAGLALLAPLVVTVLAITLLFGWLNGLLDPIIDSTGLGAVTGDVEILSRIVALVVLVVVVASLGYLAQRRVGGYVFGVVDRLIGLVPVASVIYNGVRQVSNALTKQESRFESVALVEYPRDGVYSFGFVTAETPDAAQRDDEETLSVYMPGSPNPTQGHLLMVPEAELYPVDIKVSRAIRLLVTTGLTENREGMQRLHAEVREELDEESVGPRDAL